jgi:hypothetical protein
VKKEIMFNILRAPSKYPPAQVENAGYVAAELLEHGGKLSDDGTLTVASPQSTEVTIDPSMWVPKATADALFNYLCQLLELLDHDQWTNPRGVDVRTITTFLDIKTVILSNIVNNMKASGALRPLEIGEGETPEQAALRLFGQDSREFFCVSADRFLAAQMERIGSGQTQYLELVPVEETLNAPAG